MRTPLRPGLDDEIYELEQRMQRRRAEIPRIARAVGESALRALASPAGLAAAAALGFFAAGGLRRPPAPERRHTERRKEARPKRVAVRSLLMSGLLGLVRAQYGSPFGLAQAMVKKLQSRAGPASSRGDALPAPPAPVDEIATARRRRRVAG